MANDLTPNLKLRYISSNQSQKEIVINNNFKILDDFLATNTPNNTHDNTSTAPINRLYIVVSDNGSLLYNASTIKFNITHTATGQYIITASEGDQFNRTAHLICTAYVQNKQQLPYICNVIFNSNNTINVSISRLDLNRLTVPMDGTFTLICG